MRHTPIARTLVLAALSLAAAPALAGSAAEPDPTSGLCRYPDISGNEIVFIYGNDLWIVPKQGGTARPVANPPGFEGAPRFSPDGKSIAFRANYDQGLDLYTLSVEGGIPQRVTHHPGPEGLCDWTPDGKGLIFMGNQGGFTRATKLYSVPATGGLPAQLPVPYGANGSLDKTGEWLAYTPHSTDNRRHRHAPDVEWPQGLLPVGPQRCRGERAERLELRHRLGQDRAGHALQDP
jgi:tricorn protease